jgi:UbiD family decarboxylase
LEYLESRNEVLHIKQEVDPIYEISGILKAFEKGPILMFEKIKGYPNFLNIGNVFARRDPLADLFDVDDPKKLKFKFVEAMKNPLPPKIVKEAPCQEVVITKDIDVLGTLPVIKHTEFDAGRIMVFSRAVNSGRRWWNWCAGLRKTTCRSRLAARLPRAMGAFCL